MRRKGIVLWLSVSSAIFMLCNSTAAQSYRFSIPMADVTVTIEPKGSALIHYRLTFHCSQGAHPIDVVDIGMPTQKHAAVSAAVNGRKLPLSAIRHSPYIDNGYAVKLGSNTIAPGQQAVFEFTGRSYEMVWYDTTSKYMASFRFSPTWFGSEFVEGKTDLRLRFRLPPGNYTEPDRMILWHRNTPAFQLKGVMEGENVPSVAWKAQVRMTGPHVYGVSFPRAFVTNAKRVSIWGLLFNWFTGSEDRQVISGLIVVALFCAIFFYATRFTGWTLFIVLAIVLIFTLVKSPTAHLCLYPVLLICGGLVLWLRRTKKQHYIPASISREGARVLSSLTAVEAAVLLDIPVNRILTMIICDLARRDMIEVVSSDPPEVAVVASPNPKLAHWDVAGHTRVVTRWENMFLTVFLNNRGQPVDAINLDRPFRALIDSVAHKVEGCDFRRTRDYCRFKVEQTWKRIREESDFEVRTKYADKNQGWLLADEQYKEKISAIERDDNWRYQPRWYGHGYYYHGTSSYRGTGDTAPALPVPDADNMTSFSDVVDSINGRLSNIGETMDIPMNDTKSFDLSALDKVTGDMFDNISVSSGGGSGGFGGGCACACAGCACACACAGGGR